jgi:DNA-binding transcriptional LysR family regulator
MLDVDRLMVLREVVHRGTMRAAADALAYTPSAVSQQIARLQNQVPAPLFEREGRTLRPTSTALLLTEHADLIAAEIERTESELEASLGGVAGTVTIGAFASGASELAAPAATALQTAHPDVHVDIHEMEDPISLRELQVGGIDIALLQEYTNVPNPIPGFVHHERLMVDPVLLVLPDVWAVPTRLEELAGAPWIAEPAVNPAGKALLHSCRAVGFEPEIRYRVESFPVIVGLVGHGLGVSMVPRLAVHGSTTGVQFAQVPGRRLERAVAAAVRPASRARPAVQATLEALHSVAAAAFRQQAESDA